MPRRAWLFALVLAALLFGPAPASAGVVARIDLSEQAMDVFVDGVARYRWAVSTGIGRYRTPTGTWTVKRMHRIWYSTKYNNAPMPHSLFFRGGYAVHGTTEISRLGRPASHGCVRLHPDNARILFNLVRQHGPSNSRIVVRP